MSSRSSDSFTSQIDRYCEANSLNSSVSSFVDNSYTSFKLTVRVHYKTHVGQSIAICGSLPLLGKWKSHRAFKLKWNEGHFWTATFILPAEMDSRDENLRGVFTYKYCLYEGGHF